MNPEVRDPPDPTATLDPKEPAEKSDPKDNVVNPDSGVKLDPLAHQVCPHAAIKLIYM